jgi:hypothetical protein
VQAQQGVAEIEHDVVKGSGVLVEQRLPEVRLARGDAEEAIPTVAPGTAAGSLVDERPAPAAAV